MIYVKGQRCVSTDGAFRSEVFIVIVKLHDPKPSPIRRTIKRVGSEGFLPTDLLNQLPFILLIFFLITWTKRLVLVYYLGLWLFAVPCLFTFYSLISLFFSSFLTCLGTASLSHSQRPKPFPTFCTDHRILFPKSSLPVG